MMATPTIAINGAIIMILKLINPTLHMHQAYQNVSN